MILTLLACSTPPPVVEPVAPTDPAPKTESVGSPTGDRASRTAAEPPGLLRFDPSSIGGCNVRIEPLEGGESTTLARSPLPCSALRNPVFDRRRTQMVATTDTGITVLGLHNLEGVTEPPPDGALRSAGFDEDERLCATTLLPVERGEVVYEGTTYTVDPEDGVPALAIRWRREAFFWKRLEVVPTDAGWDHAVGTSALSKGCTGLQHLRGERESDDHSGLPTDHAIDRAWSVWKTPFGRIAGLGHTELISTVDFPPLVDRGEGFRPFPTEVGSSGEIRILPPYLVLQTDEAVAVHRLADGAHIRTTTGSQLRIIPLNAPASRGAPP